MLETILIYVLKMMFLYLPAGIANISASLSKRINFLNYPVDHYGIWSDGKRIFGENKNYRGFFFGFLGSLIFIVTLIVLKDYISSFLILNYSWNNLFLLSFIFSFGALGGDLIKSFFKRRFKIDSGKPWIPFDQIDWIIGTNFLLYIFYTNTVPIHFMIVSTLLSIPIHIIVNKIAFLLKLQHNDL